MSYFSQTHGAEDGVLYFGAMIEQHGSDERLAREAVERRFHNRAAKGLWTESIYLFRPSGSIEAIFDGTEWLESRPLAH